MRRLHQNSIPCLNLFNDILILRSTKINIGWLGMITSRGCQRNHNPNISPHLYPILVGVNAKTDNCQFATDFHEINPCYAKTSKCVPPQKKKTRNCVKYPLNQINWELNFNSLNYIKPNFDWQSGECDINNKQQQNSLEIWFQYKKDGWMDGWMITFKPINVIANLFQPFSRWVYFRFEISYFQVMVY